MAQRLILFIDTQSVYMDAREAFFGANDPHIYGQYDALKLARLIASRRPLGAPKDSRELKQVRIYAGIPSPSRDSRTYSAYRRQESYWKKQGVEVVSRPLRYPHNWPKLPAEQKGVDVSLAVELVVLAIEGAYDVGVVTSTDTDLRPAIEFVVGQRGLTVEVCSWRTSGFRKELSVPGLRIWCHRLSRADYDQVADYRDYNL